MHAVLDSVQKTYFKNGTSVVALDDIQLTLEPSSFVAVCGPSGCGKSTLLMTIAGLLRPDQGRVSVMGKDIYDMAANQRAELRAASIGFVFQQFHLIPYLSVFDNILAARLPVGTTDQENVNGKAEQLMERLGIQDRRTHQPGELSTGERQRVALARALLNSPKILLADEPTGNLDEANAKTVLAELQQFAAAGGSVLLVTHDDRASNAASKKLQMVHGRIV